MTDDVDDLLSSGEKTESGKRSPSVLEEGEMRCIWKRLGFSRRLRGRWAIDDNEKGEFIHVHHRNETGYFIPRFSDLKKIKVREKGVIVSIESYEQLMKIKEDRT